MLESLSSWVVLAHLLRPQGRKGELLAELLTDFPDRLAGRKGLFLTDPEASNHQEPRAVEVLSAWLPVGRNRGRIVLQFAGIESISAAETMAGLDLVVCEEDRIPIEEGSAYVSDLVGCKLFDNSVTIGVVTDVQFLTAPDGARLDEAAPLLVIEALDHSEILIPFVKAFIQQIDLPGRKLLMNLPAGLIDVNRQG
ncbi:ribosome maturation factor RimM [Edaphobacter sp. 12200R-103]|jgi:16S rRNA processing protein RimM|uniref:ribosome maturation factor RimM n=1 Tax=Edaphobacter sp. 12200R-103 TaxID=2703788 RepID=UPI00138CB73A|nr:ribosome maturation factor RimM [Edaphobacter sp. 12200R-103]QHS51697.1 16S rRNA processing protein RimM [Edaphobacter sp. 12200R-103]